ncbi:rnd efflux pump membrane fusion protein barrel-sandwich domain [Lucifera butyrica]|uniref:Rnd efflux pump membrane fusion protein barrel-sandwich domain n=1 Tax=Lucifera butyrica TaxID=1351585 RepID=A0A498RH31_9FIRM|nr:efflux RND transporter periplasmic adaptor subunit [Lucifera butyrica]VBB09392.1 rnd efflux pump membrane fusion protein barrel-sandwich domain [Lucifera butyrica]
MANCLKKGIIFLVFPLIAAVIAAGCGRTQSAAPAAVSVSAGQARTQDMPVQVETVGNVEAYNSAVIMPQVTGTVQSVHFQEGQNVKAGDLLVTIDPHPFEQKLAQAQAQLAHDSEQAAFAASSANRSSELFRQGAVSRQDFEQSTTSSAAQTATVRQSQAAAESARIDLNNCSIRAPIDGRTGAVLANTGSLATANQTQLVVINQIQPIYVNFTVPERYLAAVRAAQAQGPLKVIASIPEQGLNITDGILTFINNTVDPSTGVIQMKARFPNVKRELWPGQFVRITLVMGVQPQAVVVPVEAVNMGQSGQYVFVVNNDKTVALRPVEEDRVIGNLAVISKGLTGGETVVTDGQVNLRDGSRVAVQSADNQAGSQGGETQ